MNPSETQNKTVGLDYSKLTLCDALDLAVLIEEEARDRYDELASQLAIHHTAEAANFFAKMKRIEELHRTQLLAQRTKRFGEQPPNVTREMIFDIEAPEYDQVRANMTLRQALETALRSEIKAHDFFASALKSVTDSAVRQLFEELRDEEVEHQNLVKAEFAKLGPVSPLDATDFGDDPVAQ